MNARPRALDDDVEEAVLVPLGPHELAALHLLEVEVDVGSCLS